MLVHHFVEFYARTIPDSGCLTQDGSTLSYNDLNQISNRVANGLLGMGIGKGDRVAILGENSPEHLIIFIAAGRIGAVTVSLNYRLTPAELAFIASDAEVRALFMLDNSFYSKLDLLRPKLLPDTPVLSRKQGEDINWENWLGQQSETPPAIAVEPQDAFLQLYTSGTTGNPKGVVLTHQNLLAECIMNTTLMPSRATTGMADIICAPMFHIGGAGSCIVSIFNGTEIILHKSFDPAAVVNDIESYPVNSVFLVPAMIRAILDLPNIENRDFSNLKQIFYGTSPISEVLLRRAIKVFQVNFVQMYGMTETTGTVVSLSPADHTRALENKPELLSSCGRPSVGVEMKIMNEQGQELPSDTVGEIWIKSDTNLQCYYNLPHETLKNITDGWVHTGDAGYVDSEGYLYLKDRIKDMVVSGGENIYPVEVENAIAHHDAVLDVAVIGVPNEKYGEALLAFVVLRDGQSLDLEQLIEFCRDKIAGYKIPRLLEIIAEIPRNASGKILKKELRKPYWKDINRAIS